MILPTFRKTENNLRSEIHPHRVGALTNRPVANKLGLKLGRYVKGHGPSNNASRDRDGVVQVGPLSAFLINEKMFIENFNLMENLI